MKIIFTLEKTENGQTMLKDDKGRLINWPADLLPAGAKEGNKVAFNIGEDGNLAKDILNEVLNVK